MDSSFLNLQIHRAPHRCHTQVAFVFLFYFSAHELLDATAKQNTKYQLSIVLMQISPPSCSPPVFNCPQFYIFLFSLEEICTELVSAIEAGDVRLASICASSLAKQRAALCIKPSKQNYTDVEIR